MAPAPPLFLAGQLSRFEGPALALFAEDDIFGGSHPMAARAREVGGGVGPWAAVLRRIAYLRAHIPWRRT
jgi:hypothetical protein